MSANLHQTTELHIPDNSTVFDMYLLFVGMIYCSRPIISTAVSVSHVIIIHESSRIYPRRNLLEDMVEQFQT
jgi:hypothetical protein